MNMLKIVESLIFAPYHFSDIAFSEKSKCSRYVKSFIKQCEWQKTFQIFNTLPWMVTSWCGNALFKKKTKAKFDWVD